MIASVPTILGGVDATFDCVATSQSLDEGLRFTNAGGHVVLVGMPGVPKHLDWTGIWYKELTLHASYAYGMEEPRAGSHASRSTWELAIEMLPRLAERLAPLVSEPFALEDYRGALKSALFTGSSGAIKTVFRISE